ncbi:DEAD-box RNA helicase PRP5 Ecym_2269 [Eremothecium cymbalariae DBVPG|uniref:RNA helicase n=1 Tax=Eremothecium cymbalariae (strain CBS 270.75 / DBVPG 7215 / KCTC 17166 / NRRL Y-17582) TaxID=931890 RepID=G8JPR0_ERECY|nr:Hypothetical protein Ecym_2269 [Eremothecium cymbalariae DBVPG\
MSAIDDKKAAERQERLIKWKHKKQEQDILKQKNGHNSENEGRSITAAQGNPDGTIEMKDADKMAERRKKLEMWKRKRQEQDALKNRSNDNVERVSIAKTGERVPVVTRKSTSEARDIEDVGEGPNGYNSHSGKKSSRIGWNSKKQTKKRSIFDDSDDEIEPSKLKLFKPGTEIRTESKVEEETEDTLEAFMKSLDVKENKLQNVTEVFYQDDEDTVTFDFNRTESESGTEFVRIAKIKARKQLKTVHYSKADLEPFVKNLYHEPEEICLMTDEEMADLRLSLDNTTVKGLNCPGPITKWTHLGLTSDVMDLLVKEFQFNFPTPIQSQAIPAIMSGRDIIGISKTGSGKTVSFLLPLLRQIKSQRPLRVGETGPIGLLLAPTRELAVQIHEEVVKFTAANPRIKSICCTGGSEIKKQINDIKRGIEIIVATPGRFIDLLSLNSGNLVNPKRIVFVVLDEADRLFDLGFEPQVNQIMKCIRPDKQCVLFSATFPTKLKSFASKILHNPIHITINSKSLINENIEQRVEIFGDEESKFKSLLHWLVPTQTREVDEKTIIFVSSQQICDFLSNRLEVNGLGTFSIHAGKPFNERTWNLRSFKETKNGILICTEVLSRGLNVPEVSLVLIYNAAKSFAQYVHTTGRTARGTNKGMAVTLLMNNELAASYILMKSMRDEEINKHHHATISKLQQMSDQFNEGLKTGEYRLAKGFGGKGLDHLDKVNEEKHTEERRHFDADSGTASNDISEPGQDVAVTEESQSVSVPRLDYSIKKMVNPDGTSTYFAHVQINDLPQVVRWEATKFTTLSSIKHETGCSITNKGRFYPSGQGPHDTTDEPKLYLLVESANDKDISLAIELLETKVREGVRKSNIQEIRSNKYTI